MLQAKLKPNEFEKIIQENQLVFIDFWAEWCMPCQQFANVYEEVAQQHPTILFLKVNIEEEAEFADTLSIRSIPHLMVFKQGILIYSEAGAMPKSTFIDLVQQAIDVDVSEIQAKVKQNDIKG